MNAKGIIRRLDGTGDTALVEWDLTEASLDEASRVFDQVIAKGGLLVRCDEGTDMTGTQLRAFDPLADEILVVPQFAGG